MAEYKNLETSALSIAAGVQSGYLQNFKSVLISSVGSTEVDLIEGGAFATLGDSILTIESDSVSDDGIEYLIQGLDESNRMQSRSVVLEGTNAITISGRWNRVFSLTNITGTREATIRTPKSSVGSVAIRNSVDLSTYLVATPAKQSANSVCYTVPQGKTLLLKHIEWATSAVSVTGTVASPHTSPTTYLYGYTRSEGSVWSQFYQDMLTVAGNTNKANYLNDNPILIQENTDIRFSAKTSEHSTDVSATVVFYLIDNDEIYEALP